MDLIQIILLALIQGFTEFLPISSSAHLILAPYVFGYSDQGLAFDLAVHLGTLLAVILYFRREILLMLHDWFKSLTPEGPSTANSRLGWAIILATIPVMTIGVLIKDLVEHQLRAPLVIATTTIGIGLLLWWADRYSRRNKDISSMNFKHALFIGIAQAIALIPGTSRSGITMAAALMLGYKREAASRFSFLLAVPTILASVIWVGKDLFAAQETVYWQDLGLGVLLSFIAAYTTIHFFLRFIERIGMAPFAIYRLILGATILGFLYL
ncbi:MAG TPA: undecaprenyl-diphosphate phosphatase [Thiolapillus brandeum]|uniref:Undecaprenyl-diphosphatase n=1 Tax=Thiolapillus brandeum TaxID=1076588 RepID=A0A831KCU8_9GAMM|nr:undecaprenyl-diphosphate phosphatase [Thiolapillus brandeum]